MCESEKVKKWKVKKHKIKFSIWGGISIAHSYLYIGDFFANREFFHFSLFHFFTFDLRSTSVATWQRHQASLCLCSRCSIGSLLTFGRPLSRLGKAHASMAFFSLTRTFGLCRMYFRSEKLKIIWFFSRLLVPLISSRSTSDVAYMGVACIR